MLPYIMVMDGIKMGAPKIQWANIITLEKDSMFFFQ
jgi:hypothetical protein